MRTVFVDANVFLRVFTEDDEGQHARAIRLLRRAAAGELALVTGPPVLFEVAWTLRRSYRQSPEQVLVALAAIAATPGLRLIDAGVVDAALELARRTGVDFADAYIAASAREQGAESVATFNLTNFRRLGMPVADI
jgi:predicted nucleic acid-binding protein